MEFSSLEWLRIIGCLALVIGPVIYWWLEWLDCRDCREKEKVRCKKRTLLRGI